MFTGTLTDCRIDRFESIKDEKQKTETHFAIIREQWGEEKWVRLMDPAQRQQFPTMKVGEAKFEMALSSRNIIQTGNDGREKSKKETNPKIVCLLDFKVANR